MLLDAASTSKCWFPSISTSIKQSLKRSSPRAGSAARGWPRRGQGHHGAFALSNAKQLLGWSLELKRGSKSWRNAENETCFHNCKTRCMDLTEGMCALYRKGKTSTLDARPWCRPCRWTLLQGGLWTDLGLMWVGVSFYLQPGSVLAPSSKNATSSNALCYW